MIGLPKKLVHRLGRWYIQEPLRREYQNRSPRFNEQAVMYSFALKQLYASGARRVLDVGSGQSAWPRLIAQCGFDITAIDLMGDYWDDDQFFNNYYHIIQDDITKSNLTGTYEVVTCISVLHHIPDYDAAMASMARLTLPDGKIIITFPYNEETFIDDVYKHPRSTYPRDLPFIGRVFSRREIDSWCRQFDLDVIYQEYYDIIDGEFWAFGPRHCVPRVVAAGEPCQFTGLVFAHRPATPTPPAPNA